MKTIIAGIRGILDRRTKALLLVSVFVSIVLAAMDAAAVAMVLPLVERVAGLTQGGGVLAGLDSILPFDLEALSVVQLALVVVGLFVAKDLFSLWYTWWASGFKAYNRAKMSTQLLQGYLSAPYEQVAARTTSDMLRVMTEGVTQVFGSSIHALMNMISSLTTVAFIAITMILLQPTVTIWLVAYFAIGALFILRVFRPLAARAGREAMDAARASISAALSGLGAQREIRVLSKIEYFAERYLVEAQRGAGAARVHEFVSVVPRYLVEVMFISGIGVLIAIEGGGASSLGTLAFFVAAGFRLLPAVTGALGSMNSMRFGEQYLRLVQEDFVNFLSSEAQLAQRENEEVFYSQKGGGPSLSVDGVTYSYPGSRENVLCDVSIDIPFGSSVGIVGGSGAGKSTLIDVMLGLRPTSKGVVRLDGVDINELADGWRSIFGIVAQDVFILEGTLEDNVAFGVEQNVIDKRQVADSLDRAQLGELVRKLPGGIGASVGERGSKLSGGQRQRVGIARALYGKPSILILDEATSALDNSTEHLVSNAIAELQGGMTLVVIAHRLSTVRALDVLIYMEAGRVVDAGSFTELMTRNNDFRRLVDLGRL